MNGNELRRVLGYEKLKSARFKVSESDGTFTFTGKGAGHGVGMCQWGAKGMAENGYSYRQILGQYYQGLFLRNMSAIEGAESARR
jgi:stage II sporulation protein D